ncbi:MAG: glycosyltransferase family 4 protein [Gammaproteobacteria bacterium]|nr:glycosyltransferase family 4 protein [Gammaproteobacteria bacterium]
MKALVIAPQPFFTPRGTPFSVYYRTMVTAEQGVKIDLLTYGEGQDVNIPGVRIIRGPRFAFLGHVKTGPSILKLFLDIFIIFKTIGLLITNRYDFVHAHEEAVFFCRYLQPVFRFKLVYDMHSSLPQQLTNFDFTSSSFLINLFKTMEDSCLHKADAVITICPALAEYVDGLISDKEKHQLIENSIFDPVVLADQEGAPEKKEPISNDIELPQADTPLIVYAGTLEHYQGIDIMLEGFAAALKKNNKLRMIIAGGSVEQVEYYRTMAENLGIEEACKLVGRVPQHQAKWLMDKATVLASPRIEGDNTPLKVYELLASGKPMFATNIYSHTQVLSDDVAFLVEPTAEGMAEGMLESTKGDTEVELRVKNAQKLYDDKYSRKVYVSKIRKLLDRLECVG